LSKIGAENAAPAPRGHFVYNRRSPSSFGALLASLGNFDDSLSDLSASRLSHAAAAIRHVHRNQRRGRSVCRPANIAERGMPNGILSCATCGRSLEETAAWKGSGERYYCNDFCAEAEAVQSPSLIPSLTEDVSARITAPTSRARL
jgi:hypothetical protein